MKTLIVNTFDSGGGAAIAALRLHQSLINNGVDSTFLVQRKTHHSDSISGYQSTLMHKICMAYSIIDSYPLLHYRKRDKTPWSILRLPNPNTIRKINLSDADIVNLHWVGSGFLPLKALRNIKKPIVWTMHDSWAFTGGCHLPYGCQNYQSGCGHCPQLKSKKHHDLSWKIVQQKLKFWKNMNITIVTPSNWLASCAKSSLIFKDQPIQVIPNGIDTDVFKPIRKNDACKQLKLDPTKKYILFGAFASIKDENKGFKYLRDATRILYKLNGAKNVELVVFGSSQKKKAEKFDFKINYFGNIADPKIISTLYSASDVFVAPSKQENLPNTIMESLSCGTPVVAFKIGGIPDLVDHKRNGFLAEPHLTDSLAEGIAWILADGERWQRLSQASRQKVIDHFEVNQIAKQYQNLFESVISKGKEK